MEVVKGSSKYTELEKKWKKRGFLTWLTENPTATANDAAIAGHGYALHSIYGSRINDAKMEAGVPVAQDRISTRYSDSGLRQLGTDFLNYIRGNPESGISEWASAGILPALIKLYGNSRRKARRSAGLSKTKIRNATVNDFRWLIERAARRIHERNEADSYPTLPLEDIEQECAIQLMKAIEKYDPRRPGRISFTRFAGGYIQTVRGKSSKEARIIDITFKELGRARRVEREFVRLTQRLGREPTIEELSERLPDPSYADSIHRLYDMAELHEPWSETLLEFPDSSLKPLEEAAIENERAEELYEILGKLKPRDEKVLRMRFGLRMEDRQGRYREHTLEKAGREIGLSRENQAARKARYP